MATLIEVQTYTEMSVTSRVHGYSLILLRLIRFSSCSPSLHPFPISHTVSIFPQDSRWLMSVQLVLFKHVKWGSYNPTRTARRLRTVACTFLWHISVLLSGKTLPVRSSLLENTLAAVSCECHQL
jgi:hypothetical protein